MSQADREKWNLRYREGAYATRKHPSVILRDWLTRVTPESEKPHAIDLACGTGRNALFLARRGWRVTAVDISEVALERLAATAADEDLEITCRRVDLEAGTERLGDLIGEAACDLGCDLAYDLAIIIRYANLPLVTSVGSLLRAGGHLIAEAHLVTEKPVAGPGSTRFRLAPGELREAASGLDIIFGEEGIVEDPDGRQVALAQIVARKPQGATDKPGQRKI